MKAFASCPGRANSTVGRGRLVVLAALAALWPGIGAAENNPMETMMWSMADMMGRANARYSAGTQDGNFNFPGTSGYPSPGYPGPNAWMPGGMPGVGYLPDWQRHMQMPGQPGAPTATWPGFSLDGTWQASSGEVLVVAGTRFHLRSGPQRSTSGYLRVLDDQMVFTSAQTGHSQRYQYVRNERMLMLHGPNGRAMVLRRMHRPATQHAPSAWGGPSGYSTYGR